MTANRPATMTDMVGQEALVARLRIIAAGTRLRDAPMPHVLLSGPAGHGKTTLAGIIARERGGELESTSGPILRRPGDLLGLLASMELQGVLFIDEVHRTPVMVLETLYEALEDGTVSLLVGHGSDARTHTLHLPPFTCVAATTKPGALAAPFRDRFGFHGTVTPYAVAELAEIVRRAWERAGVEHAAGEPTEVAKRCKGVPRLALHMAERVTDFCAVFGSLSVGEGMAARALAAFGVDERGLDAIDWRILDALVNQFRGRTVGVDALCQAIDVDKATLVEEHEGPLVRACMIARTQTGRMALPAAHELFRREQ